MVRTVGSIARMDGEVLTALTWLAWENDVPVFVYIPNVSMTFILHAKRTTYRPGGKKPRTFPASSGM